MVTLWAYPLSSPKTTQKQNIFNWMHSGIDRNMSINKTHHIAESLGERWSYEIVNMAKSSWHSSGRLTRTKPGFDLRLVLASGLVENEAKIQVEMLEVTNSLPRGPSTSITLAWTFIFTHSGFHGLWRLYHLYGLPFSSRLSPGGDEGWATVTWREEDPTNPSVHFICQPT